MSDLPWGDVPEFSLPELLEEVERFLLRYIVFGGDAQCVAVVLWILHTWVIDAFDVSPYLTVTSAEKSSGKTRVIECLSLLTKNPWHVVSPTEAVLFRKVANYAPTVLMDEGDTIFKTRSVATPLSEGLRGILNAGNRRGVVVERCDPNDSNKLVSYPVFGAKMLAGIGEMPGTIVDRSIPIRMRRRMTVEELARFTWPEAKALAEGLVVGMRQWATVETMDALRKIRPIIPTVLNDRAAEGWWPLFAIAELAEHEWPARTADAAVSLHKGNRDLDSDGIQLLRAFLQIFNANPTEPRIGSVALIELLDSREDEPWRELLKIDPMRDPMHRSASIKLGILLRPYNLKSKNLRRGESIYRGFDRDDFREPFSIYLPGEDILW